ncbi:hypothetical protein DFH07DRAFT_769418 [Mycena maculata]|uniref:Uncharacterized protein n=1 Tax=Mycena maculata TaxID=230809 RepID=A0AAD7JPV1_9AGAR|nr:hypothetical protein DFH07DRAFT_769418 [Mycena maculata]
MAGARGPSREGARRWNAPDGDSASSAIERSNERRKILVQIDAECANVDAIRERDGASRLDLALHEEAKGNARANAPGRPCRGCGGRWTRWMRGSTAGGVVRASAGDACWFRNSRWGDIAGADESGVDGRAKSRAWQESDASTPVDGNLITGAPCAASRGNSSLRAGTESIEGQRQDSGGRERWLSEGANSRYL